MKSLNQTRSMSTTDKTPLKNITENHLNKKPMEYRVTVLSIGQGHYFTNFQGALNTALVLSRRFNNSTVLLERFEPKPRCSLLSIQDGQINIHNRREI